MSTYVIAEIGINHDGDFATAVQLIRDAAEAGVDAVKFQKRTPELCVPRDQWDVPKETPWGEVMPYIEYRRRMEFDLAEYTELLRVARQNNVYLALSVWDLPSLEFENQLACPWIKIPSAKLTDAALVGAAAKQAAKRGAQALCISTGMSTADEVTAAEMLALETLEDETPKHLRRPQLWLLHCHSAYPAPEEELNLRVIHAMLYRWQDENVRIGYSGHELGTEPTEWAVAMGATIVERHITHDRSAVGSDHACSLDPRGFADLVAHIRSLERAMGDGVKRVWPSELPALRKLRGAA